MGPFDSWVTAGMGILVPGVLAAPQWAQHSGFCVILETFSCSDALFSFLNGSLASSRPAAEREAGRGRSGFGSNARCVSCSRLDAHGKVEIFQNRLRCTPLCA